MLRALSISSFRFFLAGKGLSVRTGKYFVEAFLVGLVTGFVVLGFRILADFGGVHLAGAIGRLSARTALPSPADVCAGFSSAAFASPHRWALLLLPALGATLGYLLIRRFSKLEHARGTDSAILAYHKRGGYVTGTVIPAKSVASVLTVGSGGSAGYEGPVTLLGAACGSFIARYLHFTPRAQRILMAAGLAAGIGALFQAPLAGALFGFEIFYSSSDVEYETLLPALIASAVSYTVYAYFHGWTSLFTMPSECVYNSGLRLLPYFVLALVITFGARFYIDFFRRIERTFGDWRISGVVKVAVGGLATGLIGFFVPDVLGTGYAVIQSVFSGSYGELAAPRFLVFWLLAVFVFKTVATAFTVGSGGSGGVFAPALVCGCCLGAATGLAFNRLLPTVFGVHPASFALVGMAGFLASAVRIPMTAIVIVAEISGNHGLLLPAMWVCGIAFWLNNGWSLYRSQVHSRASSPAHGSWAVAFNR